MSIWLTKNGYDPHKKHVSHAECVAMNGMAEKICTLSLAPESDSGTNNKTTNIDPKQKTII